MVVKLKGPDVRVDMIVSEQIVDPDTGELICDANHRIDKATSGLIEIEKNTKIKLKNLNIQIHNNQQ